MLNGSLDCILSTDGRFNLENLELPLILAIGLLVCFGLRISFCFKEKINIPLWKVAIY